MTNRSLQARIGRPARRVLLPLLRALDGIMQRAVSVRPDRVFYASMPDYTDSAYAMYRHLLDNRRDLEHVWLLRNMDLAPRIRDEFADSDARGHRLVLKPWSPRSYLSFLRARYIIHTHGVYGFSQPTRGRTSVCVWHGMPVKAIRRLHTGDMTLFPVFGSVHVSTSSFFRYVIAGVFGVDPRQVLLSGLPRTDVLKGKAEPRHSREQIAERLGLDPSKRWLLWLPTHRSEASPKTERPTRSFVEALAPEMITAVERAAEQNATEVVVKLHPFDVLNDRPSLVDHPGLRLLSAPAWEETGIQLYDLIAASDALITDISSVFIDYLHTGNPIGVMGFDGASYTRDVLFDPGLLLRCRRAHALTAPSDIDDFVAAIGGADPVDRDPADEADTDFAMMFNEDHHLASAEAVATAVGL